MSRHDIRVDDNDAVIPRIDYLIEQVTLIIDAEDERDEFNSNAICARTDWPLNIMVDISNCTDISASNVPRTEYDIYTNSSKVNRSDVETAVLYTGNPRGQSEDTRPVTPDSLTPYWLIRPFEE